ncbi:MAG: hypothetical protein J2P25_03265, partial [Nocardiopsaceae bacterium]|nr:hypothetical protein [Nocardiopsaceae bacterium]
GGGGGAGRGEAGGGEAPGGRSMYVFGYPSDPPFTGLYPDYCAGIARQAPLDAANSAAVMPCGMTAGDSGGPWLARFSPRAGTGTIVAISTYKYNDGAKSLYGTMLGPGARSLYQAANAAPLPRSSGLPELVELPG